MPDLPPPIAKILTKFRISEKHNSRNKNRKWAGHASTTGKTVASFPQLIDALASFRFNTEVGALLDEFKKLSGNSLGAFVGRVNRVTQGGAHFVSVQRGKQVTDRQIMWKFCAPSKVNFRSTSLGAST